MKWWKPGLAVVALLFGVMLTVGGSLLVARFAPDFDEHAPVEYLIPLTKWPGNPPADWPTLLQAGSHQQTPPMLNAGEPRLRHWRSQGKFFTTEGVFAGPPSDVYLYQYRIISVGYPFAALRYDKCGIDPHLSGEEWMILPAPGVFGGFPFDKTSREDRANTHQRQFPVLPAWPGFPLGVLCYGGVLYFLCMFMQLAVRRWRRVRSRCVICKYPVAGLDVCPECGTQATKNGGRSS